MELLITYFTKYFYTKSLKSDVNFTPIVHLHLGAKFASSAATGGWHY